MIDVERRSSEVKRRCQRAKRRDLTFSHHQNSSITLQYHMAFSVMRKVRRMPLPPPSQDRASRADGLRAVTMQPDVISDPCTLYGARRSVIEYLTR